MGNFFGQLFSNTVLVAGLCAWAIAQILKAALYAIVNRRFDASRLIGDGGFPSGHSATVTAASMAALLRYGIGSFEFAVTCIVASVVMHDAMGVRFEAGKQAKVINDIVEFFDMDGKDLTDEEKLKELVGHTPIQVGAGFLLGLLVGFFVR